MAVRSGNCAADNLVKKTNKAMSPYEGFAAISAAEKEEIYRECDEAKNPLPEIVWRDAPLLKSVGAGGAAGIHSARRERPPLKAPERWFRRVPE